MQLMCGGEDISAFGIIPRPSLRMWKPYLHSVVFVESYELLPWPNSPVIPGCILNSAVGIVEIAMGHDLCGDIPQEVS